MCPGDQLVPPREAVSVCVCVCVCVCDGQVITDLNIPEVGFRDDGIARLGEVRGQL